MADAEQVQKVAEEAAEWFERALRDENDSESAYVRTKDGAPEWVTDMVYDAHGELLPDDWRYECIRAAVVEIGETGDDDAHSFADSYVDIYTRDRLRWLASSLSRVGYCDTASDELGVDPREGIVSLIGAGQYLEASEVYGAVWAALENEADAREETNESEDETVAPLG